MTTSPSSASEIFCLAAFLCVTNNPVTEVLPMYEWSSSDYKKFKFHYNYTLISLHCSLRAEHSQAFLIPWTSAGSSTPDYVLPFSLHDAVCSLIFSNKPLTG
ncbi:hypothetical protein GOODEAATRI_010047 [Goodea atripinnis]|uniref:Secreted protein n=1 Tax=Goodea atripinnis TaxID=208336 RepID=A0ABV0NJA3_9TELE